jgi:hypothetical protein
MALKNKQVKDVFHAYLVKGAVFEGAEEFPHIKSCNIIPTSLVAFSRMKRTSNYNQFVHFYEPDDKIRSFWNNPKIYLPRIKKFQGAIAPDYSVYRDMPIVMQKWNTYRNRALAFWLQQHGVPIIPNVRYGTEETYSWCFDGIEPGSVIAIGTHGCIKKNTDIEYHIKGLAETIKRLNPKAIIVYGAAPDAVFAQYKQNGPPIRDFESDTKGYYDSKKDRSCPLFEQSTGGK